MKEPTQEQIKRFWEWCGFVNVNYNGAFFKGWQGFLGDELVHIPNLDDERVLGFIFKYAVPKIKANGYSIELITHSIGWHGGDYQCRIGTPEAFCEMGEIISITAKAPALALFWAIYKVIEGES